MRKFNDYFSNRLSNPLKEMAHDPQEISGKMRHEIRKTPIFLDRDDIRFLRFFPPKYWGKAYAELINKVLLDAENDIRAGRPTKKYHDFTFSAGSNGQTITFRNIPVGPEVFTKGLHDKFTRTVDADAYMKLADHPDPKGKEAEDFYAKNSKHPNGTGYGGRYGFDLTAPTSGGKRRTAEGLMSIDPENVSARIYDSMRAIKQGWLGHEKDQIYGEKDNVLSHDPDAKLEPVYNKRGRKLEIKNKKGYISPFRRAEEEETKDHFYTYSGKKLNHMFEPFIKKGSAIQKEDGTLTFDLSKSSNMTPTGAMRSISPSGDVTWEGILTQADGKRKRVTFTSKMPILYPSKMINNSAINDYNRLKATNKALGEELNDPNDSDRLLGKLRNPDSVKTRFEELLRSKHRTPEEDKELKILQAVNNVYPQLKEKLDKEGNGDVLQYKLNLEPTEAKRRKDILLNAVKELNSQIADEAKNVQKNADRMGLHQFNVHWYNRDKFGSSYKDAYTGAGTVHPNNNTAGLSHEGLPDWEKRGLHQYLGHAGYTDFDDRSNPTFDTQVPHVLKKKFGDEADDDAQQEIDNIKQILHDGYETVKGEKVLLTARRKKQLNLKMATLKKQSQSKDTIVWGPIGNAINQFIHKSFVYGTPEGAALRDNWSTLFQNALEQVKLKAGENEFLKYEKADKEGSLEQKKNAWNNLNKRVMSIASNYVARIWQLNIANTGTRRTRKGIESLDATVQGTKGDAKSKLDYIDPTVLNNRLASFYGPQTGSSWSGGDVVWHRSIEGMRRLAKEISQENKQKIQTRTNATPEEKEVLEKIVDSSVAYQVAKAAFMLQNKNASADEIDDFAEKFMRKITVDVPESNEEPDDLKAAASKTGGIMPSANVGGPEVEAMFKKNMDLLKAATPHELKSNKILINIFNRLYNDPHTPDELKNMIKEKYSQSGIALPEPLYTAQNVTAKPVVGRTGLGSLIKKPSLPPTPPPVQEWLIDLKKKYNQ